VCCENTGEGGKIGVSCATIHDGTPHVSDALRRRISSPLEPLDRRLLKCVVLVVDRTRRATPDVVEELARAPSAATRRACRSREVQARSRFFQACGVAAESPRVARIAREVRAMHAHETS
jgi:hypothetical protein